MNKILLGLICVVLVSPVFSHEFSPAHLIIEEDADFKYEVTWMYPIRNLGPVNLTLPAVSYTHLTLPTMIRV